MGQKAELNVGPYGGRSFGVNEIIFTNSTNEQLISCMKSASDNIDAINPYASWKWQDQCI